ncbi:MAG: Fic family protein, partial [Bacteroidota bacterium]
MDDLLRINDISWLTINNLTEQIDAFQEDWIDRTDLAPDQLAQLREMATVQSIGSSTRIEGSQLEDQQVSSLIENMQITELKSRDEQEVAGYYHTLQIILDGYEDIPITTNIIKGLHKQLMQYSTKDEHHRGNYKTLSNQVVATLPSGEQKTIFKT